MNMVKQYWKTLAIVFITLFVLVTALFTALLVIGSSAVNDENECAINICSEATSYFYDSYYNMCYCYGNNGNLITSKYLQ